MDHFYSSIPGWFDYLDLYQRVVRDLPDGSHIVEVGVYQGQSTAALAVEIANSGKAIRFDCVDTFKGSPKEDWYPPENCQALFEANVAPVRRLIRQLHVMPSVEAAEQYAPASLDFVWIDAAHDRESVLADLDAWWPKVKPGGILAGHDVDWPSVQRALEPWSRLHGVEPDVVSVRSWQITKPAVVTDWSVPGGERKCLVAVASNERSIYRQTTESLVALGWGQRVTSAAAAHGFRDIAFHWSSRQVRVDDIRNEAVLTAQAVGATHLLFLDADMTFPPDLLSRILRHHDSGMVSGLYFLKRPPHQPVAFHSGMVNLKTGQVDYVYDDDVMMQTDLQAASLIGMGCALIPMALFDAMPRPWFAYAQDQHGVWSITEDVAFCQKAAAYGCPIWVDPTIRCGHLGVERVTDEQFYRSRIEAKMVHDYAKRMESAKPALVAVPA